MRQQYRAVHEFQQYLGGGFRRICRIPASLQAFPACCDGAQNLHFPLLKIQPVAVRKIPRAAPEKEFISAVKLDASHILQFLQRFHISSPFRNSGRILFNRIRAVNCFAITKLHGFIRGYRKNSRFPIYGSSVHRAVRTLARARFRDQNRVSVFKSFAAGGHKICRKKGERQYNRKKQHSLLHPLQRSDSFGRAFQNFLISSHNPSRHHLLPSL